MIADSLPQEEGRGHLTREGVRREEIGTLRGRGVKIGIETGTRDGIVPAEIRGEGTGQDHAHHLARHPTATIIGDDDHLLRVLTLLRQVGGVVLGRILIEPQCRGKKSTTTGTSRSLKATILKCKMMAIRTAQLHLPAHPETAPTIVRHPQDRVEVTARAVNQVHHLPAQACLHTIDLLPHQRCREAEVAMLGQDVISQVQLEG